MNEIVVAIDYDDTISLNVEAWKQIIKLMNSLNFKIYIVTYRESCNFQDMCLDIDGAVDTIFTNARSKRKYCEDCGINVDIWIDDTPESIIFDYRDLVKNMEIR